MPRIRTLFLGTPSFAIESLEAIISDQFFELVGVITQPDKLVGRNQLLTPPPIKVVAEKYNIPTYQPIRVRNFAAEIRALAPDIIIVVAYGQLIPQEILDIPRFGCINVHGSLLPKYRGASVIQAPILAGDDETGITIMQMDAGLDTGPILDQSKIKIEPTDTAGNLFLKLSHVGAEFLIATVKKFINGSIRPQAQDEALATKVGLLTKADGKINWQMSATEIERQVRAMSPWPIAWTTWGDKNIKILEVESEPLAINQYEQGEVFKHYDDLAVQCGINALLIKRLQIEGKQESTGQAFLNGYPGIVHAVLT